MNFLETHQLLVYLVIFLAMVFEGDVILFSSFFLAHYGHLNLFGVISVSVCGALIGNILWYRFGKYLEEIIFIEKYAKKFSTLIDRQLCSNLFRMILLSKFTYGLHHLTIMRSGAMKVDFKKYFKFDFFSTLIWIGVIGGLGYVFSVSLVILKHYFRFAQIAILFGFLILLFFSYLFSKAGKKAIEEGKISN
jgi:membrane protein DedA with SNARE-associated domain